jgi:G3E family GTPase
MGVAGSFWRAEDCLLVTRLQGIVTCVDVEHWQRSLELAIASFAENTAFRLVVDYTDYAFADIDAHKAMRVVIPQLLSQYGFRTGLFDLVEEPSLPLGNTRGISCVAVAFVHHDEHKMAMYEEQIGRAQERFFVDYEQALAWITSTLSLHF